MTNPKITPHIGKAIREGKYLNMAYKNKNDEVTWFWISILGRSPGIFVHAQWNLQLFLNYIPGFQGYALVTGAYHFSLNESQKHT